MRWSKKRRFSTCWRRQPASSDREFGTEWSLLDLGLTSFRIMQALMEVEERFGIEFSEDEVMRFPTVPGSSLPRFVRERIAGSSS